MGHCPRVSADGGTVLLTTHYMDEAERLCDRLAIMDHGQVIAEGTPAELIARLGGHHVIEFAIAGNGMRTAADIGSAAGRGVGAERRWAGVLERARAASHDSGAAGRGGQSNRLSCSI